MKDSYNKSSTKNSKTIKGPSDKFWAEKMSALNTKNSQPVYKVSDTVNKASFGIETYRASRDSSFDKSCSIDDVKTINSSRNRADTNLNISLKEFDNFSNKPKVKADRPVYTNLEKDRKHKKAYENAPLLLKSSRNKGNFIEQIKADGKGQGGDYFSFSSPNRESDKENKIKGVNRHRGGLK